MVLGVVAKSGATVRAGEMFYKAVVQVVLIYRSERWVTTDSIMKVPEGFHHRIYQSITGNTRP